MKKINFIKKISIGLLEKLGVRHKKASKKLRDSDDQLRNVLAAIMEEANACPDFLKVIKFNLEKTDNYEAMTLSTTKNIIPEVHSFKPDVILLDMLMPSIGGLDACEMLNNDQLGKSTPIIISGLDKEQDKYRAYKEGVTDYLVKPIEKKDLIVAIENCLKYK